MATRSYPLWFKCTVILFGIILVFLFLSQAKFILMPLAFSALLAMLLEPLSQWIGRFKVGRIGAILLSMLVVFVIMAGIFSMLSFQFLQFADRLPEANERLQMLSSDILVVFQEKFGIAPEQQVDYLQQGLSNIISISGNYLTTALGATTSIFTTLSLIPFFVFFMTYYKEMYTTFLYKAWSGENNEAIDSVVSGIQNVTQDYIVGMISVVVILAILNFVGLWAIGLEHALFFATFAAILAIIPYIGIIIGSLPAFLYALLFTETFLMPVGVVGVFAFVQFLEGNFITPNIIGSRVSINPFVALVALIVGAEVWGISGMILFVPFLGILKCIFDEVEELRPYSYLLGNKVEYAKGNGGGKQIENGA